MDASEGMPSAPSRPAPPRPPAIQFSLRQLFAFVALAMAGLWCCDSVQNTLWVGRFPLQVTLVGPRDRAIVAVAAGTLPKLADTAGLKIDPRRLELPPDGIGWLQDVGWVEGKPFTIRALCSGKASNFGRELGCYEDRLLVVRIEFDDGSVEFLPAPIPAGRGPRSVEVQVPGR